MTTARLGTGAWCFGQFVESVGCCRGVGPVGSSCGVVLVGVMECAWPWLLLAHAALRAVEMGVTVSAIHTAVDRLRRDVAMQDDAAAGDAMMSFPTIAVAKRWQPNHGAKNLRRLPKGQMATSTQSDVGQRFEPKWLRIYPPTPLAVVRARA